MSTTSSYVEMKSQCYICFSLTSDEIIEAHGGGGGGKKWWKFK